MPWGRLSDDFYDHPKVMALPATIRLACVGLRDLCISWSNRFLTDGFIPTERIRAFGAKPVHVEALIRARLFDAADGGVQIHNFAVYNKPKARVLADREGAKVRMAINRASLSVRANDDVRSPALEANGAETVAEVRQPRPDQTYPESEGGGAGEEPEQARRVNGGSIELSNVGEGGLNLSAGDR